MTRGGWGRTEAAERPAPPPDNGIMDKGFAKKY